MKRWLGVLGAAVFGAGCATSGAQLGAPVSIGSPHSARGVVVGYLHGPGGRLDGVALSGGARVRFPEAVGDRGAVVAPMGMSVAVVGHDAEDARGHRFIEAERLTNTSTNAVLNFESSPTPPERGLGGSGAIDDPR